MSKYNLKPDKELDEEFERFFLKESMTSSESSLNTQALASLEDKLNSGREKNWASQIDDYDDDESIGLLGTGKKFLKSTQQDPLRKPSPRNHEKIAPKTPLVKQNSDLNFSRDSLNQGNGKTVVHPGQDTLEEMADKERFFQEIENNLSTDPDYGKLNRDLDDSNTGTLPLAALQKNNLPASNHDDESSEDDEEEDKNSVVNQEKSNGKPVSMLSQVALIESLDSTFEKKPQGSQEAPGMTTITECTSEQTARHDDLDDSVDGCQQNDIHLKSSAGDLVLREVDKNEEEENEEESYNRITDDTTTKGVTGKTVTGFTDTSHDIEALQNELQKVRGLETFGSSNNFTFEETSAFGELGDTRNKDSTLTNVGAMGRLPSAGGQERTTRMTLSELNRMAVGTVNSNDTGNRFQPSNRRSKLHPPINLQHQHPSVRFDEETKEISQSRSSEDELGSWFHQTKKSFIKSSSSAEENLSKAKTGTRLQKASGSVTNVGDSRSKDRYSNIKGSGYGHRSSATKISAAKSLWSPDLRYSKDKSNIRVKGVVTKQQGSSVKAGALSGNSWILAGNELSAFSQDSSSPPFQKEKLLSDVMSPSEKPVMSSSMKDRENEVQMWNERYKAEVSRVAKLQAAMSALEKEHAAQVAHLTNEHDQKIAKLQQENFTLAAKIESESEARLKRLEKLSESVPGDQLAQLEAEMRQQDTLLAGYQTENERLYDEMKKLRASSKATEEKMFRENQKLKIDLANLREELSSKNLQLEHLKDYASPSAVPGATRIAHLESNLKQAKVNEDGYRTEIEAVGKAKDELERKMAKEVKELKEELAEALNQRSLETKEVDKRHCREVDGLKKKLRWYVENQQLLDKDVVTLQQKDEEIKELRVKLQELQLDTGKKTLAMKSEKNQRLTDAKRIQDLERQVREMELILKKRHPNSLPVLMWAASNVPNGNVAKPPSVEYLEGRIRKLESQLEEQDEGGKRSTRTLEQKYNQAILQYESRIQELERQLAKCQHDLETSIHPHTTLLALQRELDSVRERNKKQMAEQEQTIAALTKELTAVRRREPASSKSELSDKSKQGVVERSDADGTHGTDDRQRLLEMVQKLSTDNQHLAGDLRRMAERLAEATTALPAGRKKQVKMTSAGGKTFKGKRPDGDFPLLPIYSEVAVPQKEYDPEAFSGQHVGDLVSDNGALKMKVEDLTLELEQRRVMIQKLMAEHEAGERCHQEEMEERISALKEAHQMEVQKLVAAHAVELSSSQIAELQNRTSAQDVIIQHLKEQLTESLSASKHIPVLQSANSTLQGQVKLLQGDLQEARSAHTPQMRHFEMLQEKIQKLESRHEQREQQMEQLRRENYALVTKEVAEEAAKWKRVVESKTREIDRFRSELDSMLDVLRILQRQGVVMPYAGRTAFYSSAEKSNAFSNHHVQ